MINDILLYQWDTNKTLDIDGDVYYVDFDDTTAPYRVQVVNHKVSIPDEWLQTAGFKNIWLCMTDHTRKQEILSIKARPMPPAYVYTPTQRQTFEGLVQMVEDEVADLEEAREAGEFDGPKGDTGATGPQGPKGDTGTSDWNDITNKPATFTPSAHQHDDRYYTEAEVDNIVTPIENKIPAQASAQNQLADKDFVNSSIATNTAYFRGTFNSVEELQAYSGDKTVNDYAFVISTDTSGNTLYNRYKYNGTTWVFEYALNNSSFTAAQWSAIQSGITSVLVDKLSGIDMTQYRTSSAQDTIDSGKVDKVSGKGLSTEDYTTAEKTKLAAITTETWTFTLSDGTTVTKQVKVGV